MAYNLISVLSLLTIITIRMAQRRPSTLEVIDDLRNVEPYDKLHRDEVLLKLHEAKLDASELISDLYRNMTSIKHDYVHQAVEGEDELLNDVDKNTGDLVCLNYLRTIVEHNMYMAGIFFTNCIDETDYKLGTESNAVYGELYSHELKYARGKLLDAFHLGNIVIDPKSISQNLIAKLEQSYGELVSTLDSIVNKFGNRLGMVKSLYTQSLINNKNLLQLIFEITKRQLNVICRHKLPLTE
ncbi:uncharacterized protein LOC131429102 [Malaya genurostris]|uniref:uncharacterized protein LOC131429102 n=1 Tax=Malaya genurostris TaxID=325434 RepID=UPI0026F3EAF4|nr:uncharacterized protein LOC131429102 [Malaya genurostris]